MTVAELIVALQGMDQSLEVVRNEDVQGYSGVVAANKVYVRKARRNGEYYGLRAYRFTDTISNKPGDGELSVVVIS